MLWKWRIVREKMEFSSLQYDHGDSSLSTRVSGMSSSLTASCVARFMICWVCRLYFSGIGLLGAISKWVACGQFCRLVWQGHWLISHLKRSFYWTTILYEIWPSFLFGGIMNNFCKYKLLEISRLLSHTDLHTVELSRTFHQVTLLLRNTTKVVLM